MGVPTTDFSHRLRRAPAGLPDTPLVLLGMQVPRTAVAADAVTDRTLTVNAEAGEGSPVAASMPSWSRHVGRRPNSARRLRLPR